MPYFTLWSWQWTRYLFTCKKCGFPTNAFPSIQLDQFYQAAGFSRNYSQSKKNEVKWEQRWPWKLSDRSIRLESSYFYNLIYVFIRFPSCAISDAWPSLTAWQNYFNLLQLFSSGIGIFYSNRPFLSIVPQWRTELMATVISIICEVNHLYNFFNHVLRSIMSINDT